MRESLKKRLKKANSALKYLLVFIRNAYFLVSHKRQKDLKRLERLAAKEEREQKDKIDKIKNEQESIDKQTAHALETINQKTEQQKREEKQRIENQLEKEKQAIHHDIELTRQQEEERLNREMVAIQRSTRTSFKHLAPIHNYLRTKSKLYYIWHLNPYSSSLHFAALLFFIGASVYFLQAIYPVMYQRALADASTCIWDGSESTDWNTPANWANSGACDGATNYPGSTETIAFVSGATYDLIMTSDKIVAKVDSLSASAFNKTFDTNAYDLTVNGNITWQAGTLDLDDSDVITTGNIVMTGGTVNNDTSEFHLTGATDVTVNSTKNFAKLVINKTNTTNIVTVQSTFNVGDGLFFESGTLNKTASEEIRINNDNGQYVIGQNANGGSAKVVLYDPTGSTFYIYGMGGTATSDTDINNTGDVAYLQGHAHFKNLGATSGTLNVMNNAELYFPTEASGNGKLYCAAGTILSLNSEGVNINKYRSESAGSQWLFDNDCGASTANYVDLKDAHNDSGSDIVTSNSINTSNNSGFDFATNGVLAGVKYWIGASTGNFSDNANWSTTAGGSNNTTAPSTSEYAYFTADANGNCNLTAGTTLAGIISDGYSGILSTTGSNYSLTATRMSWSSGTFTGNASTLTFNDVFYSGGTFSSTSGNLQFINDLALLSSGFSHNNGTITNTTGETTSYFAFYKDIQLYNFSISKTKNYYDLRGPAETLTVNNNLNLDQGVMYYFSINLQGQISNITQNDGVNAGWGGGSAVINISGSTNKSFSVPANTPINGMYLDNSNTTVTMGSGSSINGHLKLKNGNITFSSGNSTISNYVYIIGGTFTATSGTTTFTGANTQFSKESSFVANGGTVLFNTTNFYVFTSSHGVYFNNLSIQCTKTYYSIVPVNQGHITVNGNLNLIQGIANTGTINVKGNLTVGSVSWEGGSAVFNLNGTADQTITTSAGTLNALTINKSSGKATFTTSAGSGKINNNVALNTGVMELSGGSSGGNTFTITANKTITTAADTTLRFSGSSGNLVTLVSGTPATRWNIADSGNVYANYVSVTDSNNSSGTIYAMNSSQSNCVGWNTTSTTYAWDGGPSGTGTDWNTAANWNPDGTPDANDIVTIDYAGSAVTTSNAIFFGSLTVGGSNASGLTISQAITSGGNLTISSLGTVTQATAWDTQLVLLGDLTINGSDADHPALLTHSDNSSAESYRVNFSIVGDATVDTYGAVNVDGLGYDGMNGPGAPSSSSSWATAGSYGGKGGSGIYSGATYGSVTVPENLGSGGHTNGSNHQGAGGGAIKLNVSGATVVNGEITSGGAVASEIQTGSGGSVLIYTSTISGSGAIKTNGGTSSGTENGGGGGRGAIYLYSGSSLDSISIQSNGGIQAGVRRKIGGAGTWYLKKPGQQYGELVVDNSDYPVYRSFGSPIPSGASWQFDVMSINNGGELIVDENTALTIGANSVLSSGNGTKEGILAHRGGTLTVPADFEISNITLCSDTQTPHPSKSITGLTNLVIKSGGVLSHSINPFGNTEEYKMNLTIPGSLTIETGGEINVDGHGFRGSYGPGISSESWSHGGSYGGKGANTLTAGKTYGSALAPTNLGSGGRVNGDTACSGGITCAGGGSIQISVGQDIVNNGIITASGLIGVSGGSGSGGSVYLTAQDFSGSGDIYARGGDFEDFPGTNWMAGGGGGRISVTTSGSDFDSINFSARGGTGIGATTYGSAGTIYKKISSHTYGSIEVNNEGITQTSTNMFATLFGESTNCDATCQTLTTTFESLTLSGYGRLALVKGQNISIDSTTSILTNTSLLFIPDNDGDPLAGAWPTLDIAGDLNNSGSIISNGQGYLAQNGYTNAAGGSGTTYGGGAGFGGAGGAGAGGDGSGGQAYGSSTDTNYIGSGGGLATGGAGGGHIHLKVAGTLNNNTATSLIQANGNAGTTNGGGGSGGGILIESNNLICNTSGATISANGGNGASEGGGGGAGGRIMAVVTGTRTITSCTATSTGGTGGGGASNGEAGSVNIQASPLQPTQTLPADTATNQSQETVFTFSTTDPDSDWVRYKLEMADDSGFTSNVRTFTQIDGSQTVSDSETGTITGTFTGQDAGTGTGYTSGTTATFTIDSSTPLVEDHTYYWRVSGTDPEGVDNYDGGGPYYGTVSSTRSFTIAPIDKTEYTAGTSQTLTAGECSSIITFETRNSIDETVVLLSDATFQLTDDSGTGTFYSDDTCTSALPSNQATISTGSSSTSFYYKTTTTTYADHTYAITASETPAEDPDWTDATTNFTINPDSLDHFTMTGYLTDYTADDQFNITTTAYDGYDNIKFDYYGEEALIWYSASSDAELPYTSSSKYTMLSGDAGQKQFLDFRLQVVGDQTITLHHSAYSADSIIEDQLLTNTSTITVSPGIAHEFYLEDYPKSLFPNYAKYTISGNDWGTSGGASENFDMNVTVRDQFDNVKTDYNGSIYFSLYTDEGTEADSYNFTWDSGNPLSFDPETDQGQKQTNGIAGDYGYFNSTTSGKTLDLRISDGVITTSGVYTVYVKPLGLDYFTIATNQTLSREGTVNDQDIDEEWDHDDTPVSVTVTAYDTLGNVKVDYGYNEETGEGRIYFYSDQRDSYVNGTPLSNQEFPYIKTSSTDISKSFEFPIESAGVHTFTEEDEVFKFFKGGRRTVYVAESITPTDSYASDNDLKDPAFPDEDWDSREYTVKTGVLPSTSTIAVEAHAPGSTHINDDHSDNSDNNLTIGPGDEKLTLSWQNPFDAPMTASPVVYIYQSSNGVDYSLLEAPRPSVNGASTWQSQDIEGLSNDQQYWYKLRLGYQRSNGTHILSDYSNVLTETPKAIAPLNVTASQLDYHPAEPDQDHPGEIKLTYSLRFDSTTTFSYLDPLTLTWHDISDNAVSGDKGLLSGNFESPVSHTTYLELNTDYSEQYLNNSFKVRANVSVDGQGSSNSESNLLTLDTLNPNSTSLIINATNSTTADLTIAATDDSAPIRMMLSTNSDFTGASYQSYSTSVTNYNIEGADTIYLRFMDNYYNITTISTQIGEMPESFSIKDGSNISSDKYRLLLMWDDTPNTVHYNIWRSTDGATYSQLDTTTKNGYLDINLSSDTNYAYKVTAEDASGNISLPAGPLSSTPGSAPDVTSDPQVELYGWRQEYGVRAKITWNTDQEADSFVIYAKENLESGTSTKTETGQEALIAGDLTMTLNHEVMLYHLDPSTTYYLKSLSKNEIQITGASNVLSFTTPERIPLLIQGMEINDITISSAQATWSTSKLATTVLEYSTTAISGDTAPTGTITVTDTNMNTNHSFKLDNLVSGTKYYLRAKNTDSDGNTTTSDVYTFSTFALPQISGISVKEVSYNTATIEWQTNVNADSNVEYSSQNTELRIQNTAEGMGTSGNQGTEEQRNRETAGTGLQGKSDSTTVHAVTLIGLTPKTTYSYRVISRDSFGNISQSALSTFTTATDTTSPQIVNIKSEVASTGSGDSIKYQAIISWDTDEPATSLVEYSQGIGGDYTDTTTRNDSLNSSHVVILPDLKPNSAYHFRIVSQDLVGNTAYSDDISLITPPKEKSLLQIIIKSLEDTFSWVGRLKEKWVK